MTTTPSTSTEHVWQTLRDQLAASWVDAPHGALEQRILDVWERHPQLVIDAADKIGERFTRGVVRSPWAVLAVHVEEAAIVAERSTTPVKGEKDKSKAVQRAEQWVRAAGQHFDSESEVDDELFGSFGILRSYRDDDELRDKLLALWHRERPNGERIEREAEEHARVNREALRKSDERGGASPPGLSWPHDSDDDPVVVGAALDTANPFIDE